MAPQITHPTTPGFVAEPDKHPSDMEKDQINTNHEAREKKPDTEPSYKQEGVQRVEAITSVWTKQVLIIMFVLLYLVSFIDQLQGSVTGNLQNFITSSFGEHGLLAATDIVASIIGGVCTLTIAKIIDIWGRCEGFVAMIVLMVVGLITKGVSQDVPTYAAGHTLYWVGHIGLGYIITIILADMTTLRNRLILFGIQQTPIIATTFAGPRIADLFYANVDFRWAFYSFCIILVFFAIPVAIVFVLSKRKAVRMGVYPERPRNRTAWESCKHYFIEFDVIGMFLTVAGWSLLLLPFQLVNTASDGWRTGYVIAMIVVGVVLLALFAIWEKYFAPVQYFPWAYLKDRTILGACLLYGFMFLSIFCWDTYYQSYLEVVHFQSITDSGYILNSFSLASSFISPLIGVYIRYFGNVKWPSLGMIPFAILGTALLVRFRTPSTSVGVLVMCQLFNGFATGVWAMTGQLAIMASIDHQHIAVAIALFGLFGSIGQAIGFAIAGGLWTNSMEDKMYRYLPDDYKNQTETIYGDIEAQLALPAGSPARDGIIHAYSDVQRVMAICGSCFMALAILCIFLWRSINVRTLEETRGKQTKGMVF
ncbi:siderophore iron transporter mirB [Metarhizium acridum CQMa 102]|uniref:Siderophore iron transporter mirB n=1 Tax=Metarhizium acridum (strain CQMa 102) TaxID=655827 RepID=E9E868_METAQ|nr:siderophore iron transporter mirB [Metarhizium acridum CQMa 102]EFY87939.1 siderophore iron transporter mirB [Metarhizium acridum CQMa 102]